MDYFGIDLPCQFYFLTRWTRVKNDEIFELSIRSFHIRASCRQITVNVSANGTELILVCSGTHQVIYGDLRLHKALESSIHLSNDINGLCDFNVISWQADIRTGDGADHTFSGKLLG
jgi:hypothetical protein